LSERISQMASPPTGRIERLRIQLEAGVDEAVLVERIADAIVQKIQWR